MELEGLFLLEGERGSGGRSREGGRKKDCWMEKGMEERRGEKSGEKGG